MNSAEVSKWRQTILGDPVERDVRTCPARIREHYPAILGRLARDVTKRRLPERDQLIEPHAANEDRADPDAPTVASIER